MTTLSVPPPEKSTRRQSRFVRLLIGNRAVLAGLTFLVIVVLAALLAPLITTHDPASQSLRDRLQGPSWDHWLGTDTFGRDVYSRLVYSARVTMLAVVEVVIMSAVLGIPAGLLAGSVGGWIDGFMSRVSDAIMSLPGIILAMAIVAILGPGLVNVMIAIGILLAPYQFRLARAAAQSVSTETYIEASRAIGCSWLRTMWRHLLPNCASTLLVQAAFCASITILIEASLSFLGLGVRPPTPSWGSMLRDGFDNINESPWFIVAPALVTTLTVMAFSTIGDGLRDALEGSGKVPRAKSANRRSVGGSGKVQSSAASPQHQEMETQ